MLIVGPTGAEIRDDTRRRCQRLRLLHASSAATAPWQRASSDPELAARWRGLERLTDGSLGLAVSRFYRARGFSYPRTEGPVSPLLAQHDWVHVLADHGATIDNQLEVFAFIARANDDPRGFSFLAMVVSLFESGMLTSGAGLFEPDAGHLQLGGMPGRLGDAMRRGVLCHGTIDFLGLDWFEFAHRQLNDLREEFGIDSPNATWCRRHRGRARCIGSSNCGVVRRQRHRGAGMPRSRTSGCRSLTAVEWSSSRSSR